MLRDAFAGRAGVEVDTQGDALFVGFARATDAVTAADEARRALEGGPIRVRMGIHTGEPIVTEEGYVGIDVHRAARIAAAGHGGQIVLSETTRGLLELEVTLRDLGEHRLKDLMRAEREQLLQRLDSALPLLTGGARDAHERQRTLRATIEWSYELLDAAARRLFAQLSVFAGSYPLVAAEEVCGADSISWPRWSIPVS